MGVLSGYQKVKRYIKQSDGYKLLSQWVSSNSVEMDSGDTLETKMIAVDKSISDEITRAKDAEKTNADNLSSHTSNTSNPHSVTKSQVGLGNVEDKSSATIRGELTKSNVTTALGYTPYTPNEIDNKFSTLETNIDWKESVATYDDITTTYPNPEDGWTVNVKDTDYTYRYSGSAWVAISANSIPKATNSVNGLLSKEDHTSYSSHLSNTSNPHSVTASQVGLGNVGNFKAVSTVASQGLTDTEKANARTNIGAGTSSFSGSYTDLTNKPTITDTKVTAVGNHYTPSGGTTTSASGGTLTDITNSSSGTQVITGITKDAAGHVTGVTSVALKSTNTNTTYPISHKTIDANFSTNYRTQTKGDTNSGDYISTIRNDTSNVSSSPQYGSGLAFGRGDTHGYLYMSYSSSSASVYVGAGNADKLNWTKALSFSDHTHNYAGSSSAGGSATSAVKLDTSAGSSSIPVYFSSGKPTACTSLDATKLSGTIPSSCYTNTTYSTTTSVSSGSSALITSGGVYTYLNNNFGVYYGKSSTVSASASTWVNGPTITVPKGTYLIIRSAVSASGYEVAVGNGVNYVWGKATAQYVDIDFNTSSTGSKEIETIAYCSNATSITITVKVIKLRQET